MQPDTSISHIFIEEASELLAEIEAAGLRMAADQAASDDVNLLLRAFHTIKGSGSMCGFDEVADFTHHVETLLEQVREEIVPVSAQLSSLILAAADHISLLLACAQGQKSADAGAEAALLDRISQLTVSPPVPVPTPEVVIRSAKPQVREATVRVPAARLDRLVNLVGELVMNQSLLATAAARLRAPELATPVEEIERLVAELREAILQIRMMPIGSLFARFRRLIHDLSVQLAKEIALVTEGEDTELDKGILDQLGEPLVHLLRNSVDHGIESPADRRAKGKPSRGTIRLIASHRGSEVVVCVEDDGKGLDRAAIRAQALARKIIAPDANLSDKEILHLILLPGFSTAASVSSLSGRGIGMDAVKRQIDALGGSLTLASEPGSGTRISLTLPLTLAIIDGLLVESAESQYIIPMAVVTETVELTPAGRARNNGRSLIPVRGELIPYIDLRELFAMGGAAPSAAPGIANIVLVQQGDQRLGLVVDRVIGSHQTVIQALGSFFAEIEVVSGSTVMGDGRVALILDVPGIVRLAQRSSRIAA